MRRFYIVIFLIIGILFGIPFSVQARAFNPNYIIGDEEILDNTSMTLQEIQSFLIRKGSYLANYTCSNPDGKPMTAAEAIYDRATNNKVNPKFILVLLQKEQSLIEDNSPSQSQLDWACGYGCPDGSSCNTRWKGLWKQINSASLQFRDYMDNPQLYTYKKGQTYIFTNPYGVVKNSPMEVTPYTNATAALYNYTPHVYNGNYNFFNLWEKYFTRQLIDGSLVQEYGKSGVWLIENGLKRPFLSKGALTSRYDINKIITVTSSDLSNYDKGKPIKYPQYAVLRSPKGTIYLTIDDKRRGFKNMEAFRKIGINPEEIINASWDDINFFEEIEPITSTSTYPTGALLQNKKTGGVFWVINGKKSPIWDASFLKTSFKYKKIISVSPEELAKFPTIDPYKYGNGELLKSISSTSVFIVTGGKLCPFASGEIFMNLGFKWNNILTVPDKILGLYETGDLIIPAEVDSNNNSDTTASSTQAI
jgi:hypothetical protein